ncbi:hypothetical protein RND81_10G166400 [Saponaria officinalis]|uniref:Lachrymatory factor synthase n=1 Tax=Saponaria officinalis TaxID=3572 RepID=A0AAW1I2L1_SAPOF
MGKQETEKWEGETRVEIQKVTTKQIWPLISDFCSLHKWFPHVKTCYLLDGVPGQPGMIRYCGSTESPSEDIQWVTEKLLTMDTTKIGFSYEIVDNNVGFKTYVSTIRLESIDGLDGAGGCRIVWSFVADPVEGYTFEGLIGFIKFTAEQMAARLEQALHES